MFFVADI